MARRGKKAFLSEQCKEIEENNRMGRISSRKSDTKGTFQGKMGTIKDINGNNLIEADIMQKWQE